MNAYNETDIHQDAYGQRRLDDVQLKGWTAWPVKDRVSSTDDNSGTPHAQ